MCRRNETSDKDAEDQSLVKLKKHLAKANRLLDKLREMAAVHSKIYSTIQMKASGFSFTGEGDTTVCEQCFLKVSNWTKDMVPHRIHAQLSPTCPYVREMKLSIPVVANNNVLPDTDCTLKSSLFEATLLQKVRVNSYARWPHRSIDFTKAMVSAGWFYCNIDDRVLCIYCKSICHQWQPETDDPCEVHRTVSPTCLFVQTRITPRLIDTKIILSATIIHLNPLRFLSVNDDVPRHHQYENQSNRRQSFQNGFGIVSQAFIEELVANGFFCTNNGTQITCFWCAGSLYNWNIKDNLMVEHVRWFPNCRHAKSQCDQNLYDQIQESQHKYQSLFK